MGEGQHLVQELQVLLEHDARRPHYLPLNFPLVLLVLEADEEVRERALDACGDSISRTGSAVRSDRQEGVQARWLSLATTTRVSALVHSPNTNMSAQSFDRPSPGMAGG